jgi:hypothetical protein
MNLELENSRGSFCTLKRNDTSLSTSLSGLKIDLGQQARLDYLALAIMRSRNRASQLWIQGALLLSARGKEQQTLIGIFRELEESSPTPLVRSGGRNRLLPMNMAALTELRTADALIPLTAA